MRSFDVIFSLSLVLGVSALAAPVNPRSNTPSPGDFKRTGAHRKPFHHPTTSADCETKTGVPTTKTMLDPASPMATQHISGSGDTPINANHVITTTPESAASPLNIEEPVNRTPSLTPSSDNITPAGAAVSTLDAARPVNQTPPSYTSSDNITPTTSTLDAGGPINQMSSSRPSLESIAPVDTTATLGQSSSAGSDSVSTDTVVPNLDVVGPLNPTGATSDSVAAANAAATLESVNQTPSSIASSDSISPASAAPPRLSQLNAILNLVAEETSGTFSTTSSSQPPLDVVHNLATAETLQRPTSFVAAQLDYLPVMQTPTDPPSVNLDSSVTVSSALTGLSANSAQPPINPDVAIPSVVNSDLLAALTSSLVTPGAIQNGVLPVGVLSGNSDLTMSGSSASPVNIGDILQNDVGLGPITDLAMGNSAADSLTPDTSLARLDSFASIGTNAVGISSPLSSLTGSFLPIQAAGLTSIAPSIVSGNNPLNSLNTALGLSTLQDSLEPSAPIVASSVTNTPTSDGHCICFSRNSALRNL